MQILNNLPVKITNQSIYNKNFKTPNNTPTFNGDYFEELDDYNLDILDSLSNLAKASCLLQEDGFDAKSASELEEQSVKDFYNAKLDDIQEAYPKEARLINRIRKLCTPQQAYEILKDETLSEYAEALKLITRIKDEKTGKPRFKGQDIVMHLDIIDHIKYYPNIYEDFALCLDTKGKKPRFTTEECCKLMEAAPIIAKNYAIYSEILSASDKNRNYLFDADQCLNLAYHVQTLSANSEYTVELLDEIREGKIKPLSDKELLQAVRHDYREALIRKEKEHNQKIKEEKEAKKTSKKKAKKIKQILEEGGDIPSDLQGMFNKKVHNKTKPANEPKVNKETGTSQPRKTRKTPDVFIPRVETNASDMSINIITLSDFNEIFDSMGNTHFRTQSPSQVYKNKSYTGDIKNEMSSCEIELSEINGNINSKNGSVEVSISDINGNITSELGSVEIKSYSKVKGNISSTSGSVEVRKNSKVEGNISTRSGSIEILDNSGVKGNVVAKSGSVEVIKSFVDGNVQTYSGSVEITNARVSGDVKIKSGSAEINKGNIDGTLTANSGTCRIENSNIGDVIANCDTLKLSGNNLIKNLTLKHYTKQVQVFGNTTIYYWNNDFEENSDVEATTPEFTLPCGTEVTGDIYFDSKKEGVLYIEDGAKFSGKVHNGTIKKIETNRA